MDDFTPIIIKGVVFNEMKGATDPDRIFYLAQQNNLFPDHTYACESGGEPLAIPSLTHENLLKFHKSHYHPANSWCITYGDSDITKTLEYLEAEMLALPKSSVADTGWLCEIGKKMLKSRKNVKTKKCAKCKKNVKSRKRVKIALK